MKRLIGAIVLPLLIGLDATGQVGANGTIIVIYSSQNEIVFAADSRVAFGDSYSDKDCKIRALGGKALFAASGRGGQRNKITHVYSWDANTFARNAFVGIVKKGASQHIADQLASAWGIAMKRQLEQDIAADRSLAFANTENDGTIALGAFADFEKDGTFLIVVERLVYEVATNGAIAVKAFVDYKTTSQSSPYYMGKGEIAREAYAHQTPRSKEWQRDFDMGSRFSADPVVFATKYFVSLTIDNYPAMRTDSKGTPFSIVGGPIAVARLTTKGVEWIEKGNCPQK